MINETIKKNGITYGIISGIFSCLLTASLYTIDLNLFIKPWIGIFSMAIYLIIGIVLLSKTKRELQGDFSFKDAFTTYFIAAAIGILISTLFNILLWNFIDLEAKETLNEITIKYSIEIMQKFNSPASVINEAIKDMKENSPYDTVSLLKGLFSSLAFSSILGLIMAAFFKTRKSQQE